VLQHVARDLELGVEVVGAPTVREPDGLAMSSRNRYLSAEQRITARAVPTALRAIARTYEQGGRDPDHLLAVGRGHLDDIDVEYLELREASTLNDYDPAKAAVALIACRVGTTRLIDNLELASPKEPS